ncbi:MAG: hypothetical protein NWR72_10945 [Bacteroidia bacterium]|nr:hypothetical protein [Bacteroidia bacterium]
MKSTAILTIALLSMSMASFSCKEVLFTEAQPQGIVASDQFPDQIRGVFRALDTEDPGSSEQKFVRVTNREVQTYSHRVDSMPYDIDADPNRLPSDLATLSDGDSVAVTLMGVPVSGILKGEYIYYEVTEIEKFGLSDSVIFKSTGPWSVLNLREKKGGKYYWTSLVVEQIRNEDILVWFLDYGEEEGVSTYFDVKQTEETADYQPFYYASPSQSAFKKYVDAGGFKTLVLWLNEVTDPQLVPSEWK